MTTLSEIVRRVEIQKRLKYEYSSSATYGDNPHAIWSPDRNLFNSREKYEVITMINEIIIASDWFLNLEAVAEIEEKIRNKPHNLQRREDVLRYVINQFLVSSMF